jgi:hypothetical protein
MRTVSGNFMRTILITLLLLNLTALTVAQNHSLDTTFKINKQVLHVSADDIDSKFVLIKSSYASQIALCDTIDAVGLANIEFPDFNNDSYPDILITYFGNNPTYFLYLFDYTTKHYKSIHDYMNYPDAVQLKSNRKYYYSYYRAGCADMNWGSDLFKIVDYKIIQVGHIDAQGCDFEKEKYPQIIRVFKVINNDKKMKNLITELSYVKTLKKFDNKWEFIEKYWNQNLKNFD